MSGQASQTLQIYGQVVENVIEKMQNEFINSGIDEAVLADLRDVRSPFGGLSLIVCERLINARHLHCV